MKRKELAEYVDKMSDFLEAAEPVAVVNTNGPKWYQELAEAATPDKAELNALHYGAIAALVEVHDMLTGEVGPTNPKEHAKKMIAKTVQIIVSHRIEAAIKSASSGSGDGEETDHEA